MVKSPSNHHNQYLDDVTFRTLVSSTPLVSIDLVIKDVEGKLLLGLHTNRPAQNNWFVPGGHILKNEHLADAFSRLVDAELGINLAIYDARFVGVYDHFYPDSIWGESGSTHYLVTAFEIELGHSLSLDTLPDKQHTDCRWFSVDELLGTPSVHEHTKWYFTRNKGFK